ncbi:AT-hook motif nuclear-localized protein 8-like [Chenopodium quinoa]|uniref:AT-hook motif nuclear-localized protein 8-like n=1 Tax=Chenopodium quinoa TaxID=63459 RepID=UPI000B78FF05|nr:AT-hook motif nuclear-localized protein 8-like [Chenopodium quinoa]
MLGSEMTNVGGSSGGVDGGGMQNPPTEPPQAVTQNIPVVAGSEGIAVSRPVSGIGSGRGNGNGRGGDSGRGRVNGRGRGSGSGSGNGNGNGESSRKRRGRPRKNGPEFSSMAIPLSFASPGVTIATPPPQQHQRIQFRQLPPYHLMQHQQQLHQSFLQQEQPPLPMLQQQQTAPQLQQQQSFLQQEQLPLPTLQQQQTAPQLQQQQSFFQQEQPPLQQQQTAPQLQQQQSFFQQEQPPLPTLLQQQTAPQLQQQQTAPQLQQQQTAPQLQQQPPPQKQGQSPLPQHPPLQEVQQQPQQPPLQEVQQPSLLQQPPHLQEEQQPPPPQPQQEDQQQLQPQQQQGGGSRSRVRGRPRGGGRVRQGNPALCGGLNGDVIIVNTGEDISSKIMSLTQSGASVIFINSAIGSISSATIRPVVLPGDLSTYEGRFEIVSLSGSFRLLDGGSGPRSWSGGLTVSLKDPDGRILGGGVAGLLTAASPVQVAVFCNMGNTESVVTPARPLAVAGPAGPRSPPSHGTLSESPCMTGIPFNQTAGAADSTADPLIISVSP